MNGIEAVILGTAMGTLGRILLLRVDYRQYPSSPQGYCINVVVGAIASALGSVAVQAFSEGNWVAVTFLATGAQHFRDIRAMERNSLLSMEEGEQLRRGDAYIEDIAKRFESRNYICLVTALFSCIAAKYFYLPGGMAVGLVTIFALKTVTKPRLIREFSRIEPVNGYFEGPLLMSEQTVLKNIALERSRQNILKSMRFCRIIPQSMEAYMTLSNWGQRQAILFDTCAQLGIGIEEDEPDFMPIIKFDAAKRCVIVGIMADGVEERLLLEAVGNCLILEGSKKKPRQSRAGEKLSKYRGGKDGA